MRYKWSRYNYFEFDEKNKKFVCYNTKSGAVLFGNANLFAASDLKKDASSLCDYAYFTDFFKNGFIIPEDSDELSQLKEINSERDTDVLYLTLVPTLDCNFACPYCYQREAHNQYYMSEELKHGILNFIKKECLAKKIKRVETTWFGGEPTLTAKFIEDFMRELQNVSRSTSQFETTTIIVTNGYLLNNKLFERLYNNYVRIFQITIDGNEENHNKYRILKDGNPSFHIIYDNLLAIKKSKKQDFIIHLRANFLKDNIDSMKDLVDLYKKDFSDDERFTFSFRPVLDFTGDFEKNVFSKAEARRSEYKMLKYMQQIGLSSEECNPMFTLLPMPISRWCRASEALRYIINYDGGVFRCDSVITENEQRVGNIELDGRVFFDSEKIDKWLFSPFQELSNPCLKCKRLPVCMGGCVKERIKTGRVICHWTDDYIRFVLKNLLEISG